MALFRWAERGHYFFKGLYPILKTKKPIIDGFFHRIANGGKIGKATNHLNLILMVKQKNRFVLYMGFKALFLIFSNLHALFYPN